MPVDTPPIVMMAAGTLAAAAGTVPSSDIPATAPAATAAAAVTAQAAIVPAPSSAPLPRAVVTSTAATATATSAQWSLTDAGRPARKSSSSVPSAAQATRALIAADRPHAVPSISRSASASGFLNNGKGHAKCVYLGSVTRVDQELANQNLAILERRRAKMAARLKHQRSDSDHGLAQFSQTFTPTTAGHGPGSRSLLSTPPTDSSDSSSPEPSFDLAKALEAMAVGITFDTDLYDLGVKGQGGNEVNSLRAPVEFLRPGATAQEERALIEEFFQLRSFPFPFIHKPTYIRDLGSTPALLRAAVCTGAIMNSKDRIVPPQFQSWYFDRVRDLAEEALEHPSIGALQGLLILAFTSQLISVMNRRPSLLKRGLNYVKPPASDDAWFGTEETVVLKEELPYPSVKGNMLSYYGRLCELHERMLRFTDMQNVAFLDHPKSLDLVLLADFDAMLHSAAAVGDMLSLLYSFGVDMHVLPGFMVNFVFNGVLSLKCAETMVLSSGCVPAPALRKAGVHDQGLPAIYVPTATSINPQLAHIREHLFHYTLYFRRITVRRAMVEFMGRIVDTLVFADRSTSLGLLAGLGGTPRNPTAPADATFPFVAQFGAAPAPSTGTFSSATSASTTSSTTPTHHSEQAGTAAAAAAAQTFGPSLAAMARIAKPFQRLASEFADILRDMFVAAAATANSGAGPPSSLSSPSLPVSTLPTTMGSAASTGSLPAAVVTTPPRSARQPSGALAAGGVSRGSVGGLRGRDHENDDDDDSGFALLF
ncbi:hypothetical protein HK405_003191 [Cladochytrium tenue]|nr:hypothetical protein HK405_003191 [Cladochytrium tenue]